MTLNGSFQIRFPDYEVFTRPSFFTVMLPAHALHGLDQTRDVRGMAGIIYSLSEVIYIKRVAEQSISLIIAKWPETTAMAPTSSARGL